MCALTHRPRRKPASTASTAIISTAHVQPSHPPCCVGAKYVVALHNPPFNLVYGPVLLLLQAPCSHMHRPHDVGPHTSGLFAAACVWRRGCGSPLLFQRRLAHTNQQWKKCSSGNQQPCPPRPPPTPVPVTAAAFEATTTATVSAGTPARCALAAASAGCTARTLPARFPQGRRR